jgi:hypothetical protein
MNLHVWPTRDDLSELRRPWKLATFAIALAVLFWGAFAFRLSDWDLGISLSMALPTYALSPWAVRLVVRAVRARPRGWPLHVLLGVAVAYVVADLLYWGYNRALGHGMVRFENFIVSFPLFVLAGIVWSYYGSLRDLAREVRVAITARR